MLGSCNGRILRRGRDQNIAAGHVHFSQLGVTWADMFAAVKSIFQQVSHVELTSIYGPEVFIHFDESRLH